MHHVTAAVLAMAMTLHVMAGTPSWLMPNAWTIGIHLAQWIIKDQKKVYYVEVTSQGRDFLDAREQAFRMAVEQAVGSVISTDTRVQLGRLQRDEIIVYSSGFIENYEQVDVRQQGSMVQIKMRVWVSHNKLANRLLSESRTAGSVEGGRISTQIESFQHERATADRLLSSVLRDFPRRGFDLTVGNTRVIVDQQRQTFLQVPVTVTWSRHYLDSMAEAIRAINQRSDCREPGIFVQPRACDARSRIAVGGAVGYFDDLESWTAINREMVMSRPQILMRLLDTHNQVQYQGCFGIVELDQHLGWVKHPFIDTGGGHVTVSDRLTKTANLLVDINSTNSRGLDRVEAEVVRLQDCPRSR
jgi:hypothetical protein